MLADAILTISLASAKSNTKSNAKSNAKRHAFYSDSNLVSVVRRLCNAFNQ